ncbi:protein ImuA [Sphaerotilus hippei]|uniref:Protein ImuA n=1 Tax=Sphaerotilus hippei TaxID=744406 RepID=A0A318H461_9BURK|nr:translesion DNA synthesis-associated protein ImuA [Sphaerotilus hippei]PXW98592.1 protein ImuA [Sphaerotilus hippei]
MNMRASTPTPAGGPAVDAGLPGAVRAALWHGDQFAAPVRPACPTGHAALDAELPGGGWPRGTLTELLLPGPGQGELRLLAPALARLGAEGRELAWIGPPHRPHTPALQALGLQLRHLLWVQAERAEDAAWAAEQAVRSGGCGAVLWWTDDHDTTGRQALGERALRRLHLAAQHGDGLLLVLRPGARQAGSSPAPLRLRLQAAEPGWIELQVFKRRGPPQTTPLRLDLRASLGAPLAHRLQQPAGRPPTPAPRTPSAHGNALALPSPADAAAGRARVPA